MKRVCVFCGSSSGGAAYVEAARAVGALLAAGGIGLVFGGGRVGLMGTTADAALAAGGSVIGVIPQGLVDRELAHRGVDLRIVSTMHERKALMESLSDGFVALPGGYGTMDELFEIVTWSQLGLHDKPIGLLNVGGYFDSLLAFLDRAVAEGFVKPSNRSLILSAATPAELLGLLAGYKPSRKERWAVSS